MNALQRGVLKLLGFSQLIDAANYKYRFPRPQEAITIDSTPSEVSLSDWQLLLSDSRKLFSNLGPVKGAICDKATYAIGRAWAPKFTGKDKAWGARAEQWLMEEWYPTADVRGSMFDFVTDLYVSSISIDRDGEVYVLLAKSKDGWPQIQLVPAHMIGCRNRDMERVDKGPYKGLRMVQGVILNNNGRPVAYRVLGEKPEDDRDYSARDMIQIYDPEWADQVRGFPAFTHALLDLRDLRETQDYEKSAIALASSLGLKITNETGAPDPNDPMTRLRTHRDVGVPNNGRPTVVTQEVAGGTAWYMRAGAGEGVETMKHDRPGPNWESFMNRLIRNACVGAGWPYEMTWDIAALGGANTRAIIGKAERCVMDRQDLLRPVARRITGYAVANAINLGILEPNDQWYAWRFTLPRMISVDHGRDAKATIDMYDKKLVNMGDVLAEQGKDLDIHIAERKAEEQKLRDAGLLSDAPEKDMRQEDESAED